MSLKKLKMSDNTKLCEHCDEPFKRTVEGDYVWQVKKYCSPRCRTNSAIATRASSDRRITIDSRDVAKVEAIAKLINDTPYNVIRRLVKLGLRLIRKGNITVESLAKIDPSGG